MLLRPIPDAWHIFQASQKTLQSSVVVPIWQIRKLRLWEATPFQMEKEKRKWNRGGRKHVDPLTPGLPLISNEPPKSFKVEISISGGQAIRLPPSLLNAWVIWELRPGWVVAKCWQTQNIPQPLPSTWLLSERTLLLFSKSNPCRAETG